MTRRGEPLLVAFKMKGNATRRSFPLLVAFKTKGNTTRRGKIPPHRVCHFCWVDVVEKGKMGGLRSWQQLLGGQILKENIKKWCTLYIRCPFPSLPCAVSCCCRPPFVFSGAAGGWLGEGGMAGDSKR